MSKSSDSRLLKPSLASRVNPSLVSRVDSRAHQKQNENNINDRLLTIDQISTKDLFEIINDTKTSNQDFYKLVNELLFNRFPAHHLLYGSFMEKDGIDVTRSTPSEIGITLDIFWSNSLRRDNKENQFMRQSIIEEIKDLKQVINEVLEKESKVSKPTNIIKPTSYLPISNTKVPTIFFD